ncbi:hypothetical protein WISP_128678 [Willisornis vidua]|uniref:Uncharacterized protein n=1 Tax=Willisornis vidua TaxID=1566151 RepID=A0ABQ9CW92_9PASS|nr:hypothetical protein WISP_128678 [Willisornis vidua]
MIRAAVWGLSSKVLIAARYRDGFCEERKEIAVQEQLQPEKRGGKICERNSSADTWASEEGEGEGASVLEQLDIYHYAHDDDDDDVEELYQSMDETSKEVTALDYYQL